MSMIARLNHLIHAKMKPSPEDVKTNEDAKLESSEAMDEMKPSVFDMKPTINDVYWKNHPFTGKP